MEPLWQLCELPPSGAQVINLLLFGPKVEQTRLLRGNDKWQELLRLLAWLEETRGTSGTGGTDWFGAVAGFYEFLYKQFCGFFSPCVFSRSRFFTHGLSAIPMCV